MERNPRNRIKNWTGTVHFANEQGGLACGNVRTHHSHLAWTVEDVNCTKCIAICGADEITGQSDPVIVDEHVARRAAERAARRSQRGN